jgi:AraC-like DNA-binding protein
MPHLVDSALPQTHWQPFIRAYAQRDVDFACSTLVQTVTPSLEHVLEFDFEEPPLIEYADGKTVPAHRIAVVGPHSMADTAVCLKGRIQSFAIFFTPFGFSRLFRTSNQELLDDSCDAHGVLGPDVQRLWQELADCQLFSERITICERFLAPYAMRASGETPITRAADQLFRGKGMLSIPDLAEGTGLGRRQFERRFASSTGLTPKRFARISRFQMALDRKLTVPALSWLSIAHEFGYHDQNHMVRDFRLLCGSSPGRILGQLGDMRPPALASDV